MKYIQPYLLFNGTCSDAMEFYNKSIGGELHKMGYGDMPGAKEHAASKRLVHAAIKKGDDVLLMASDAPENDPSKAITFGNSVQVVVECESVEEQDKLFAGISEGGKVFMQPAETFWGARFAQFEDKFGINWMLNFALPK